MRYPCLRLTPFGKPSPNPMDPNCWCSTASSSTWPKGRSLGSLGVLDQANRHCSALFQGCLGRTPVSSPAWVSRLTAGPRNRDGVSELALFPWLTVLGNVQIGLEALGLPDQEIRQRALAAIDLIGLDGFESAYPRELSGG